MKGSLVHASPMNASGWDGRVQRVGQPGWTEEIHGTG